MFLPENDRRLVVLGPQVFSFFLFLHIQKREQIWQRRMKGGGRTGFSWQAIMKWQRWYFHTRLEMDFTCRYTLLENREYRNDIEDDDVVENKANEYPHHPGNSAGFGTEMLCTYLKKAMRRLTISIYCTKRQTACRRGVSHTPAAHRDFTDVSLLLAHTVKRRSLLGYAHTTSKSTDPGLVLRHNPSLTFCLVWVQKQ